MVGPHTGGDGIILAAIGLPPLVGQDRRTNIMRVGVNVGVAIALVCGVAMIWADGHPKLACVALVLGLIYLIERN